MLENIGLAFQGVFSHKIRSFLTMLGIIIGIAAIITIVSTIKGTNEQIKKNLIGAGTNVVNISLTKDNNVYDVQWNTIPEGVSAVTETDIKAMRELKDVVDVSAYHLREYADGIYYGNDAYNGSLYGIDMHYFNTNRFQLNRGREFIEDDHIHFRKVAIVDEKAAGSLFNGEDPLGKTLEIQGEPFTVVGVVSRLILNEPIINNLNDYYMYGQTQNGAIFVPSECWDILYRYDEPMVITARARRTDDMTAVGKAVADKASELLISNTHFAYQADDLLEQVTQIQSLSESTNNQLLWIAGISLLVGGIGVMNIMLVSVTERTREIGLKIAVGAKGSRIMRQFLTEAAMLTLMGGVLGVAAGIGLSYMLSHVMGTPVAISIPACVIAVAFSTFTGIVFGLVPAIKAAQLNPIEALRHE